MPRLAVTLFVVAFLVMAWVLTEPLLRQQWQKYRAGELEQPLLILGFALLFVLPSLLMLWRVWRRSPEPMPEDAFAEARDTEPAPRRWRENGVPRGCIIGPLVFLVAGLGFALVFVLPAIKSLRALDWDPTECQILASSVATHSGDDGATYSVEVTYRYEVDGVEYTGDRYRFLGGSSSGRKGKQEVVDALPPGAMTSCWVNPEDPQEAVLDRRFSWEYAFALLPLVFVVLGAAGLILALRARTAVRERGLDAKAAIEEAARPLTGDRPDVLPEVRSGSLELEPTATPLGKLLGISFFALFWNGILAVFIWHLIREPELLLGCFLVPFVLVGLLLLIGVPYQALALANPRPHLRLTDRRLYPGGATNLHWHFTGAARRLQNLRIDLEGREKVTYRSGDSSSSSTAAIARIELVDWQQRGLLGQGNVAVEIPAGAMHTFHGRRNRIVWMLTVRAEIARWPDVNEEFEVTVLPQVES